MNHNWNLNCLNGWNSLNMASYSRCRTRPTFPAMTDKNCQDDSWKTQRSLWPSIRSTQGVGNGSRVPVRKSADTALDVQFTKVNT
jgi:hypothetical protein